MGRHLVPPPAMAFLGEMRRGAQSPRTFQHGEFDSGKGRAKDLLTSHARLFILWNDTGVCLAVFLLSGAVGWLARALVRKRTEKSSGKVQDVTKKNELVNQGWAGLHCVKVQEF